MPILTVIAGPNGSGKSTLTRTLTFEGRDRLLNPDTIALALNNLDPAAAAITAGREVLEKTEQYLTEGVSFAVETTLSSGNRVSLIDKAKSRGFEVHLCFIALDTPERCILRVRNRVRLGGHFVPDADIRRRYAKSIANAIRGMQTADLAKFFDNSEGNAELVLVAKAGIVVWRANPLPPWLSL